MEKRKISANIVADSVDKRGNRITSFILTYPRFILPELLTHRMFSRNSASSRAIPFEKMSKSVEEDPFIPIAWQKDHKGMQGTQYLTPEEVENECILGNWLIACDDAVGRARGLNTDSVTKQLCNRLLEPFLWHTVIVTATAFENFFDLRCPKYRMVDDSGVLTYYRSKNDYLDDLSTIDYNIMKDYDFIQWMKINDSGAEIHMQALAEAMWDEYNDSKPNRLKEGEFHIPFDDKIEMSILDQHEIADIFPKINSLMELKLMIAVARCARLSYNNHNGEVDFKKDIELHDMLLSNKHLSPFDHCAQAMTELEYNRFLKVSPSHTESGWCEMYRGFKSYRYVIQNERK